MAMKFYTPTLGAVRYVAEWYPELDSRKLRQTEVKSHAEGQKLCEHLDVGGTSRIRVEVYGKGWSIAERWVNGEKVFTTDNPMTLSLMAKPKTN